MQCFRGLPSLVAAAAFGFGESDVGPSRASAPVHSIVDESRCTSLLFVRCTLSPSGLRLAAGGRGLATSRSLTILLELYTLRCWSNWVRSMENRTLDFARRFRNSRSRAPVMQLIRGAATSTADF